MPRPLLFRVLDAVEADGFPEELRHLCIRYAYSANAKTGVAWFGQEKMARVLGISERQLRRRLSLLDERVKSGTAPVRIARRRRGAPGGTGRSSDEWRIEVLNDNPKRTPASGSGGSSSGRPCPDEVPHLPEAEPDIHDTSSGHPRSAEPDIHVLGSSVGIQRSDPAEDPARVPALGSEPGFALSLPEPPKPKRAGRGKAKRTSKEPKPKPKAPEGYQNVIDVWCSEYERVRGCKPVVNGRNGKAAKDLLAGIPLEEVLAIIRRAFADRDWALKFGELHDVAPNRWRGAAQQARGRMPTPKQPSGGYRAPGADDG